ncbi:MAG: hypothetical protein LBE34_03020 [Flavobacteriaceae bacterium]|jgi:hypothetical protein|nr:hypothetical protein [Flavobacteriaceae bacterium]
MPEHFFFYLGLTFILMHEMDAIRCKEWRIFPGLSFLSESKGKLIFIIVHFPLFLALLIGLQTINIATFSFYGNLFMIIHFVLHLLFLRHKNNEFKDALSWIIIIGSALCGMIDLIVL